MMKINEINLNKRYNEEIKRKEDQHKKWIETLHKQRIKWVKDKVIH